MSYPQVPIEGWAGQEMHRQIWLQILGKDQTLPTYMVLAASLCRWCSHLSLKASIMAGSIWGYTWARVSMSLKAKCHTVHDPKALHRWVPYLCYMHLYFESRMHATAGHTNRQSATASRMRPKSQEHTGSTCFSRLIATL